MINLDFRPLFYAFILILVLGVSIFGVSGYFIGKNHGYKKGVNDVLNGKIKVETKVDSSIIIHRI